MRAKRSKKYRKVMQQYEIAFGFREPYQVLGTSYPTAVAVSLFLVAASLLTLFSQWTRISFKLFTPLKWISYPL